MEDYDHNLPKKSSELTKISKRSSHQLHILTYNVRTLSSHERLIELNEALANIKYDIIGLSEIRRLGNEISEYDHFILCHTGQTPGKYGVGFFINKHLKNNIESYVGISERVALLNIRISNKPLTIIQVYAPTEAAQEEEVDTFYEDIYEAISMAYEDYILMGDFNSKIGKPQMDEHLVTRQYGYGERNARGQRLIDFALENKLAIINTFYKKKPKNRWTWRSPNGQHRNEIDFIMSKRPQIFQNIETLNLDYPSDHRPLRGTITLATPKKSRANYINKQYSILKSEEEISRYREYLTYNINTLEDNNKEETVQTYYDKIINIIRISLQSACKKDSPRERSILTERTKNLIKRKQELQKTKNKSRSQKNELKALYKLTSKYIKIDYQNHRFITLERHLEQKGSTKKGYKELRTNKTWIKSLKKEEETKISRAEIIKVATDFYRNLYSATITHRGPIENYSLKPQGSNEISGYDIEPIGCKEIIETVRKLKSDKSPGSDHITNDAIKIGQDILARPLTNLFNQILENTETPTQWSESNIILLYKKGDPENISNYRPISLLPSIYKLFSTIINQRINVSLEQKQPIEQAGFRKGFSTMDHIHTLELIIEKFQEQKRPLYVAFIDYQKAFDTVSHESIWTTLTAQQVETKYIDILKAIYTKSTSRVKLETIGPSFQVKRGVRQGDPLSPRIFIAILESIISNLDWQKQGLLIQGKTLSHLRFADDLVLLAESAPNLQYMIETLHKASRQVGLEMNISKTKIMSNYRK